VRLFRRLAPFAVLILSVSAHAASPGVWVGTWATAPMQQANKDGAIAADTTLRQIVHVSLGGSSIRVVFTNEYGTDPLILTGASVALPVSNTVSDIRPGSAHPLSFSGHPGMTIPPGAVAVSDPVDFPLAALSDLAISAVLPAQPLREYTVHTFGNSSNFQAAGDQLSATTLDAPHTNTAWFFLKSVDVQAPAGSGSIVAFGDSITDGAHSTRNANAGWPNVLATRLHASKTGANLGVLNTGIGGNRILHDGTGPSALARFDRDVIAQAGVRYVIVLESINDIGHAADPKKPYDIVTADDLITGLSQLARRAHTHGIKFYGATLTPYLPAGYSSPAGEAMRDKINHWIRTSPELDGFIDFDAATRDPNHPESFLPAHDSGDHLHPGDTGYKAMGESIDLKLFR
jgi:lysophospholipase L1-like esterase